MIRCLNCGGINSDYNSKCEFCDSRLPPKPVREYLLSNSPIFTIAALFGALTFYLSTLVKTSQASIINGTFSIIPTNFTNSSHEIVTPANFTYSILIQPNTIFQKSIVTSLPPNEVLIFAFLSCFLILSGIILILVLDLLKTTKGNPYIQHLILYVLFLSFVLLMIIYILSLYLVESVYFIFFGIWLIIVYLNVKFIELISMKYDEKKYYSVGFLMLIDIVVSLGVFFSIGYYFPPYVSPLEPTLQVALLIGAFITMLLIITLLLFSVFGAFGAFMGAILNSHMKSHPRSIIAQILIEIPSNITQNCKEIIEK